MTKKSKTVSIPEGWVYARPDEDWLFIVCRALHFLGRPAHFGDIAKVVAKHPRASGWDKPWLWDQVVNVVIAAPGIFTSGRECDFKDQDVRKHFDEFDKARRWSPYAKGPMHWHP